MRLNLTNLNKMKQDGDKITMLTCYDASFAAVLDGAGVDTLLIGDSLGMVLQGHDSTLPVTLTDVAYHTACVARGSKRAWIIADMPFGSFQLSPGETFKTPCPCSRRARKWSSSRAAKRWSRRSRF